jgi:hypothetical protein
MTSKQFPQDLTFAGEQIYSAFWSWHENGYINTLGDLLRMLRLVEYDMGRFDGDALIIDHWEDLRVGLDYIELFGDPNDHDDELPLTFEYRLENVDEDIMYVEELIEGLGESYMFDDLPKPKCMKAKPTVA